MNEELLRRRIDAIVLGYQEIEKSGFVEINGRTPAERFDKTLLTEQFFGLVDRFDDLLHNGISFTSAVNVVRENLEKRQYSEVRGIGRLLVSYGRQTKLSDGSAN
ncbi:MAG: hypothetical protein AABX11_03570 [Nanoarchaeota archaeon]